MPTATVNDIQLNYEIHGAGEPLLFIHGLGGSLRDWDAQIAHFARRYQVIAVDVRGHGDSDKPPGPYSVAQFAADMLALLDALGIDAVHVCGISMGGMISFQMAADAPQRLRSLTVVSAGPALLVDTFQVRRAIWMRALLLRLLSMRSLATAVMTKLLPGAERAEVREATIERMSHNKKRHYRAAFRALINWSVLEHLPRMTMPTLILTGDLDYSTPEQKQAFVEHLPNARMEVIAGARHALPVEWPDRFNSALTAFLEERSATPHSPEQASAGMA